MLHTSLRTVAVVLVLAAPPMALAATHKYPGDYASPQEAVNAAQPGDKVIVAADWSGRLDVVGKRKIKILGKKRPDIDAGDNAEALRIDDCEDVVVTGLTLVGAGGHAVTVQGSRDCVLKGLTVSGAGDHGIAIGSSTRITVQRCEIYDASGDAVNLDQDLTGLAPDDCVVTKNDIHDIGDDGVDATGSGHVISKNRIETCGSKGVNLDTNPSDDITVDKNRVSDCREFGIHVRSSGHTVTRNRVSDTDDDGIRVDGDGSVIAQNRIMDTGDDCIDVEGEGNEIDRNVMKEPDGDGIDADGDNNTYTRNKVTGAGDDGIEIESSGSLYERNKFLKNDDHGLVVQEGRDNRIIRNVVKKNDDTDMWTDYEDDDENTWENNRFGTGNAPD